MAPNKTSTPVAASRRPSASTARRVRSSAMRKGSAGGSMHTAIPVASDSDSDSDSDQSFYSAIDIRSPSPQPVQPPPRRRTLQERLAAERAVAAERAKRKQQVIDLTSKSDTSDASDEDSDPEEGLQFYGTGRIPSLTGPSRNVAVAPVRHSAHAGPSNTHPGYIYTRDGFTSDGREIRASSEMTDDPGLMFPHSMLSFEMPSAPMLDVPVLEFAGGLVPEDQDVIVEDPQAEFEAFISSLPEGMVSFRSHALNNEGIDEAKQALATAAAVIDNATAADLSDEAIVTSTSSSSLTSSMELDTPPTESHIGDQRGESALYETLLQASPSHTARSVHKRPRPPTPPLPSDDEEFASRSPLAFTRRSRPLTPPLPEDEMDIEDATQSTISRDTLSQHSRSPSPRSLTPKVPSRRSRPSTPPGTPPPLSSPPRAKRRRPMTPEGTPPPLEDEESDVTMGEAVEAETITAISSSIEKTPPTSIATRTRSSSSAKKPTPTTKKTKKRKAKKQPASSGRQLHPLPSRPARGMTPADDSDLTPRAALPEEPASRSGGLVPLSSDAKRLKAELSSRAANSRSDPKASPPLPEVEAKANSSDVARLAAVFRAPVVPSLLSRLTTTNASASESRSRPPNSPPSPPTPRPTADQAGPGVGASPSQSRLLSRLSSTATKQAKEEDKPVVKKRQISPQRSLSERIGVSSSRSVQADSTRPHNRSSAVPQAGADKKPSLAERLHASRTSVHIPRSGATSAIEPTGAPPSPPLTAASSNNSATSSGRGGAIYDRIHGKTELKAEADGDGREQCSGRNKGKGKASGASGGLRGRLGRGLDAQSEREVSPFEVQVGAFVSLADRLARR